jgi:hypothetical protein
VAAVMLASMTILASSVLRPSFWLVAGLPWPDGAATVAECAVAVAPDGFKVELLSTSTRQVFDLARHFATHGRYRVVFLAELTRWLDRYGQRWESRGIDFDRACHEITTVLPGVDQRSYFSACDSSREGIIIHFPNGSQQQLTEADRHVLRKQLTQTISQGWPTYVQSLHTD